MSPFAGGLLFILAELGALALLFMLVSAWLRCRARQRERQRALQLVAALRAGEAEHRQALAVALGAMPEEGEAAEGAVLEELLGAEKQLYQCALALYLGHADAAPESLRDSIEALHGHYCRLLGGEPGQSAEDDLDRNPLRLRKENARLRELKVVLENDLEAAMSTMENMMSEYAAMYEGNKQAGEQHARNEMFRIRKEMQARQQQEASAQAANPAAGMAPDPGAAIPELNQRVEPAK